MYQFCILLSSVAVEVGELGDVVLKPFICLRCQAVGDNISFSMFLGNDLVVYMLIVCMALEFSDSGGTFAPLLYRLVDLPPDVSVCLELPGFVVLPCIPLMILLEFLTASALSTPMLSGIGLVSASKIPAASALLDDGKAPRRGPFILIEP